MWIRRGHDVRRLALASVPFDPGGHHLLARGGRLAQKLRSLGGSLKAVSGYITKIQSTAFFLVDTSAGIWEDTFK